jgi:hypothetical protein
MFLHGTGTDDSTEYTPPIRFDSTAVAVHGLPGALLNVGF